MLNTIIGLCGYIIVIAIALYTLFCFTAFRGHNQKRSKKIYRRQRLCILIIQLLCNVILYVRDYDIRILVLYGIEVVVFLASIIFYQIFYKGLSRLVLNNMLMLLVISFVMLKRISVDYALKQLTIAALALAICIFVPIIIKKFKYFDRLGWQYAMLGIVLLALVYILGVEKNGSRNWVSIAGVGFQPSEFVKIIYVFFISALLSRKTHFKHVVAVTVTAAVHVLILVVQKDLGSALIYFFTYVVMLYVATGNYAYLGGGIAGGSVAACIAYKLFSHVRVRVSAWLNPWADIDNKGYQVTQSLFAIGMGGWFGLGLGRGKPGLIPVVESDFIFSAIAEELGGIFVICLLLIYISCFIMFVNIAMKIDRQFYKLTAFGLAILFLFQVFLAVGGVIKFIPSTGVTLPLISYGGSSVISTVMLFSVIQGMYVLNGSEGDAGEEQ
ncbi:MAG: FtsW/RodA/SpoVE family cell cycle protein [Lachnospiraceae bacterium]|nr:FtsW/RodA/SpoVE family cell cycle protein [Lachnospiraceae bacterium]